jgi:hypothetical protein
MFQTKVVKKIETFYVQELFFKNRAVYETSGKNMEEPDRLQMAT